MEQLQLKDWNVIWRHFSFGKIPLNQRQVSCAGSELKGNLGGIGSLSLQQALRGSFSGAGDLKHAGSRLKVQKCSRTEQPWADTKISYIKLYLFFFNRICNHNRNWFWYLNICLESVILCFRPAVWINTKHQYTSLANKAFISYCFWSMSFPLKGKRYKSNKGRASYDISSYFYHYPHHETLQYLCYYLIETLATS